MVFVRAQIVIRPAHIGTGLKCQLRKTKKSAATFNLYLSATVAKEMNIADGDGIEVMMGEGEHHGLVRIRKNNSAADTKAVGRETGKGAFFLIRLGHQSAFVDRSEPSAWCQFEKVEEGWTEIVLPKWADETRPRKPSVFDTPPPPAFVQRGKQNVTASLMGDPPPGRREMLAKIGDLKP